MSKPKPGITKVFLAGHDWPGLVSDVHGQLSTLVEKRLGYKLAASPLFSKKDLDDHQPEKGWFMRHQVVMGDQEKYGFNINADGYPADTIEKYHPTFVTNGHVFREHNNQDPRKAIGKIAAVRYSRKLGRVETLEHLEIKKAEAEYETARAGKPLLASQACRVPFDVCNACGHKAKYASNYCQDMRLHPKQYIEDRQKYAFVINPITKFFDSSVVVNPAAREARHIAYRFAHGDQAMKAASSIAAGMTGAERAAADGLVLSDNWDLDTRRAGLLGKLASIEAGSCDPVLRKMASVRMLGEHSITDLHIKTMSKLMPRTLWSKLASAGAWLPLDAFVSYVTGDSLAAVRSSEMYKSACACLPSMFSNLQKALSEGTCCAEADDIDTFSAADKSHEGFDPAAGDEVDQVLQSVADDCSLLEQPVRRRLTIVIKTASALVIPSAGAGSHPLTEMYALYKLAALNDMISRGLPEQMTLLGALQNHPA